MMLSSNANRARVDCRELCYYTLYSVNAFACLRICNVRRGPIPNRGFQPEGPRNKRAPPLTTTRDCGPNGYPDDHGLMKVSCHTLLVTVLHIWAHKAMNMWLDVVTLDDMVTLGLLDNSEVPDLKEVRRKRCSASSQAENTDFCKPLPTQRLSSNRWETSSTVIQCVGSVSVRARVHVL